MFVSRSVPIKGIGDQIRKSLWVSDMDGGTIGPPQPLTCRTIAKNALGHVDRSDIRFHRSAVSEMEHRPRIRMSPPSRRTDVAIFKRPVFVRLDCLLRNIPCT